MEGTPIGLPVLLREPEFTDREEQILHLLGCACSRKEIYEALNMAERTLNTHTHHISMKTGCSGYAALVRYAQDRGYGLKISGARTTEPLKNIPAPSKTIHKKTGDR